jgi:plasmid stabilization system protein ParE
MIGYRFLSVAEEEMSEAALFYEAAFLGLGEKFLADVDHTIDRLRRHPDVGVEVAPNLRRALLHRFPFGLIYSVESDGILIVSVAHHRRRPDYWRSRRNRYLQ